MSIVSYMFKPKKLLLILASKRIIYLSDKRYISMQYKEQFKHKLDLKEPKTFNEKLQWLKLYDRNAKYIQMVDKYEAKEYVTQLIGKEYIIPTLGVFERFKDIDFDKLPNRFVLKCTHDSGGLIICRDKTKIDIGSIEKKINKFLKRNYYYIGREWPYKNVKPRIIVEQFMQDGKNENLRDYKFYCFNGTPKYLYVSEGLENHSTAKIEFFDMDFKPAKFGRSDYKRFEIKPIKPINFEKMKEIAKRLSKNIPFVRVDFYEVNGKVYFGELTFYPRSGLMPFEPPEYDRILGDMLQLPKEKRVENEK